MGTSVRSSQNSRTRPGHLLPSLDGYYAPLTVSRCAVPADQGRMSAGTGTGASGHPPEPTVWIRTRQHSGNRNCPSQLRRPRSPRSPRMAPKGARFPPHSLRNVSGRRLTFRPEPLVWRQSRLWSVSIQTQKWSARNR